MKGYAHMKTDFYRKVRPLPLLLLLGIPFAPVPASAQEAGAGGEPSFPPLSPNLSLPALPVAGPGLLEGAEGSIRGLPRKGHAAVKGGLGFTLSPTDFLLIFEADYFLSDHIAVGPLLQFGVDDDPFIFAPTVNFQAMFDIPDLEIVKPFVQGGLGVAYMDERLPRHRGWRDDVGFLFNFGGGVEVFVTEHLSLGNNILFNILPVEVLGDHFFFSWQFVTVRFQF